MIRAVSGKFSTKESASVSAPAVAVNSFHVVESDWMATTDRAVADARHKLDRDVSDWLARAGIPRTWQPPKRMIDRLIRTTDMKHSDFKYAVMHKQVYQVDFSKSTSDLLVAAREREIGGQRLLMLVGGLAFLLVALGAVSGYIRADEATKGYYTNQLRVATALGLGAAGYVAYRFLA
jgi:hypothetical protein